MEKIIFEIEKEKKEKLEKIFNRNRLDIKKGVEIFLKKTERLNAIPFDINEPEEITAEYLDNLIKKTEEELEDLIAVRDYLKEKDTIETITFDELTKELGFSDEI